MPNSIDLSQWNTYLSTLDGLSGHGGGNGGGSGPGHSEAAVPPGLVTAATIPTTTTITPAAPPVTEEMIMSRNVGENAFVSTPSAFPFSPRQGH